MNEKSKIEAGQPGQQKNNEQTAQNEQVSQPIANTNVVGSLLGQREIKFRAWLIEDEGFTDEGPKMTYNLAFEEYLPVNEQLKSVPFLMQYTGLKDKNGKEIYEGDILNGRNRILKIVYWCDKRAAFCESEQFKPIPAKHSFAKLYDKFGKIFNKNGRLENHFIVGNIFENPELLQTL